MKKRPVDAIFDSYCYGPVDIMKIRQGDSTMWLSLQDADGRTAHAVYQDCVYWQLGPGLTGIHLSLVQKISASELAQQTSCAALLALEKNASNVSQLLEEWESAGLSFFLHFGTFPKTEFLVVARHLHYFETN